MDEKISRGELPEAETFDDFTKLDHLEALKEKLGKLLGDLTDQN